MYVSNKVDMNVRYTLHVPSTCLRVAYLSIGAVDSPAMKQLISQYPSAAIRKLEDYPHNPPEHENITYYRSQVTITLSHHQDVVGDSKQYFFDAQISREEAIKDAILQISLKESKFLFLSRV